MVMERLDAAKKHPDNQDDLRQFAIDQARRLLRGAGVVDPGHKIEKQERAHSKDLKQEDLSRPEVEFRSVVRSIISQLPGDLPVGSLIYWSSFKRRHDIAFWEAEYAGNEYARKKVEQLKQLPETPADWVEFQASIKGVERSNLTRMFNLIRQLGDKQYLTRIDEVDEALVRYRNPDDWQKTERFVHYVFQGL